MNFGLQNPKKKKKKLGILGSGSRILRATQCNKENVHNGFHAQLAALRNLVAIGKLVDRRNLRRFLLPIFERIDDVNNNNKPNGVAAFVQMTGFLMNDEKTEWARGLLRFFSDTNWKVRKTMAENILTFQEAVGVTFIRENLLGAFRFLSTDYYENVKNVIGINVESFVSKWRPANSDVI